MPPHCLYGDEKYSPQRIRRYPLHQLLSASWRCTISAENGGENVLFSSFDLDTRSPDCEAIPISVTCGIKAITTGLPITYNKNFIMSTLKTQDKNKEKTILFAEKGHMKI